MQLTEKIVKVNWASSLPREEAPRCDKTLQTKQEGAVKVLLQP